jgi:YVTN family beta-propeller protein
VIDAKLGRLVAKIPVGALPYAIDFSPDGNRAYVAASGANTVIAIDTATRQVIAQGRAGHRPWIARATPDGKLVVVSNRDDATVSLLNATTLAPIAIIGTAPSPEQIEILPDSSRAFVTSGDVDQISAIDLTQHVLLANLAIGGTPSDLVLKPDGGELYIPSAKAHGLLIVNTSTIEVGDFLLLGMSPITHCTSPTRPPATWCPSTLRRAMSALPFKWDKTRVIASRRPAAICYWSSTPARTTLPSSVRRRAR